MAVTASGANTGAGISPIDTKLTLLSVKFTTEKSPLLSPDTLRKIDPEPFGPLTMKYPVRTELLEVKLSDDGTVIRPGNVAANVTLKSLAGAWLSLNWN